LQNLLHIIFTILLFIYKALFSATSQHMITFEQTGIRKELLKAVSDLGFEIPMPVQEQVIPAILTTENDIVGLSQTGSGKTAAYGLPILNDIDEHVNSPQALILCPTRELCLQISKDFIGYSKYLTGIRTTAVYGGASIEQQIKELKDGAQIVVATPGRMNDLIRRKKITLKHIKTLILDEADEMLNMGFKEELNSIIETLPAERRTLLFSATMPADVMKIASTYMHNVNEIVIGSKNAGADTVKHHFYVVHASDRYAALKRIVDYYPTIYGIIFCRTRSETKEVAEKLMKDGYNADALHGDLSQSQREYAMHRFRLRNLQMLVATDVAARGLDVEDLTHVINYNLPDDEEIYIHRSGRTGRAGKTGISVSICNTREKSRIERISKMLKKPIEYKSVPSGEEICEKQLFSLINRMENIEVNTEQIVDFLPIVYKKLEWLSREDLIARFVSVEFNRFLNYYKDASDINANLSREKKIFERPARNENSNMALFRINLGRMDKLNPQKLIGLVNDSTHTRNILIGRVTLNNTYSTFEADKGAVALILKSFSNISFEGRKVIVGLYEERNDSPRERSKNNQRSFGSAERNDGQRRDSRIKRTRDSDHHQSSMGGSSKKFVDTGFRARKKKNKKTDH
jgi:ATP-dependent RNA helicase DeaD